MNQYSYQGISFGPYADTIPISNDIVVFTFYGGNWGQIAP